MSHAIDHPLSINIAFVPHSFVVVTFCLLHCVEAVGSSVEINFSGGRHPVPRIHTDPHGSTFRRSISSLSHHFNPEASSSLVPLSSTSSRPQHCNYNTNKTCQATPLSPPLSMATSNTSLVPLILSPANTSLLVSSTKNPVCKSSPGASKKNPSSPSAVF